MTEFLTRAFFKNELERIKDNQYRSPFKSFNRFAPFNALRRFKSSNVQGSK